MTAPRTASQRGKASRAKGAAFERAVANAIRPWFPDVRRSRDNGSSTTSDTGDLAGAGEGLFWSLKDDKSGDTGADFAIRGWLTEASMKGEPRDTPLLVQKRRGIADPLRSWCWLWLVDLAAITRAAAVPPAPMSPVRLELHVVLELLVAADWIERPTPLEAS